MQYRQSLRNTLRKRFRSEYLGQLSRLKTKDSRVSVKEGDIVLIGQDNLKRLEWPLARVIKIFPGKDGIVRVAKVKTATGELVRPIQRLYPLEISSTTRAAEETTDAADQMEKADDTTLQDVRKDVRTRSGRLVKTPDRFRF
ncbi:hypothetical protein X777_06158 [Ooceraea biroi]|uniref:DUF5641 domain-containing protein n=1 Tax=Ooceraea biroi TaxID=2015173 RepID=A0A026WEC3_OOCBI|nr:hypothetical protein X777_06158 [Ooceraea biroi]